MDKTWYSVTYWIEKGKKCVPARYIHNNMKWIEQNLKDVGALKSEIKVI